MPTPSGIQKAIDYIKANWKEGRTLKEIASIHRIDPGNLARAFRAKEGATFKEYMDGKRKQYVTETLRNSGQFGYEIGADLGFKSDLAFYRWTKRTFGTKFSGLRSGLHDKKR